MPGASVTTNYGADETTAWAFTYSTRVAWYPFKKPVWSFVGEVFGTEGENTSIPEYKLGVRYEPSQYAVFAVTYGQEFNGKNGAGFELGLMLFTPQFACFGYRIVAPRVTERRPCAAGVLPYRLRMGSGSCSYRLGSLGLTFGARVGRRVVLIHYPLRGHVGEGLHQLGLC